MYQNITLQFHPNTKSIESTQLVQTVSMHVLAVSKAVDSHAAVISFSPFQACFGRDCALRLSNHGSFWLKIIKIIQIIVEIVVGTVELCGDKSWRKMERDREKKAGDYTTGRRPREGRSAWKLCSFYAKNVESFVAGVVILKGWFRSSNQSFLMNIAAIKVCVNDPMS